MNSGSLECVWFRFAESSSLTHDHETDSFVKACLTCRRDFIPAKIISGNRKHERIDQGNVSQARMAGGPVHPQLFLFFILLSIRQNQFHHCRVPEIPELVQAPDSRRENGL
jgi:hypothetical protein